MGYDMYMESEQHPDFGDRFDQETMNQWKEWFEGVESRDGYYRLNIWGMSTMREILYEGDCLYVGDSPMDAIESAIEADTGGVLPAYKVGSNDGWLVTPAECIATAMTWFEGGGREKARDRARAWAHVWNDEPDDGHGTHYTEDTVLEWADDFVQWMGKAAAQGGFRVN